MALGLFAFGTGTADAAGGCITPSFAHLFDGQQAGGGSVFVYGAVADISYEPVSRCVANDGTSGVLYWTMVQAEGQPLMYAQDGYIVDDRVAGTNPMLFTEYNDGTRADGQSTTASHWRRKYFGGSFTLHGFNNFAVGLNYQNTAMNMLANNVLLETTPFDPSTKWTSPWVAFFSGETWDPGDDQPGKPTAHAKFRNLRTWSTNGWGPPISRASVISNPGFYKQASVEGGFDIWTDRTGGDPVGEIIN